jgi:hypothetical protein
MVLFAWCVVVFHGTAVGNRSGEPQWGTAGTAATHTCRSSRSLTEMPTKSRVRAQGPATTQVVPAPDPLPDPSAYTPHHHPISPR